MESNIPIPRRVRWNDFRAEYIPPIFLAFLLGMIGYMVKEYVIPKKVEPISQSLRVQENNGLTDKLSVKIKHTNEFVYAPHTNYWNLK